MGYTCVLAFVLLFCSSCSTGVTDAEWRTMLDRADSVMAHEMDVREGSAIYTEVSEGTRNQLIGLRAQVGLMKTAFVQSRSKDFNVCRDEAERLNSNISSAVDLMTGDQYSQYMLQAGVLDELISGDDFEKKMQWIVAEESDYARSMMLVHEAACLTDKNECNAAIDTLKSAMHLFNVYHLRVNPSVSDTLFVCRESADNWLNDSLSTEMRWIADVDIIIIPEWIAAIREQLSITYGAMGLKAESDYNHNLYFDILDATRHDLRTEVLLEIEQQQRLHLYSVASLIAVLFVSVICLSVFIIRRRGTRRRREYEKMKEELNVHFAGLYDEWMTKRNDVYLHLDDELEETKDAFRMNQQRIEEGKRAYVNKAAAVSIAQGIVPFLDRALNVIDRSEKRKGGVEGLENKTGEEECRKQEYQDDMEYLCELLEKISEYNTALGHWVKIRQGAVTLHVETFLLDEVLEMLAKARSVFDTDGVSLHVASGSGIMVKADKALTFFMLNTLMDNARKFTPRGGHVSVDVCGTENYAELSVTDNGYGMNEEELQKVLCGYSQTVGVERAGIGNRKGSGFGLMNCKGIIEKYKKTNRIFDVCVFGATSHIGEGSRFYFRLPLGKVVRMTIILFFSTLYMACSSNRPQRISTVDNQSVEFRNPRVYELMDSVYNSNTQGRYKHALDYADQMIRLINAECKLASMDGSVSSDGNDDAQNNFEPLVLLGDSTCAEVALWNSGMHLDYNLILSMRNEIIISALSLNNRVVYEYNNRVLRDLYQCVTENHQLNQTYDTLRSQNNNFIVVLNLIGFFTIASFLVFLLFYYRKYILPLFNLRQIEDVNNLLLDIDDEHLIAAVHNAIDEISLADTICVAVYDSDLKTLNFRYHGESQYNDTLEHYAQLAYLQNSKIIEEASGIYTFLLVAERGENAGRGTIGVLVMQLHGHTLAKSQCDMIEWVSRFLSVRIFCSQTRVQQKQLQLELAYDEELKSQMEQDRLHVRNMILDNCLSAIKHETMYYPDRLRHLLDSGADIHDISELAHYYKDVLTLLLACATKQLENTAFRRKTVVLNYFARYFTDRVSYYSKRTGLRSGACNTDVKPTDVAPYIDYSVGNVPENVSIICDVDLLEYLIDSLLALAFSDKESGSLSLTFTVLSPFVIFTMTDSRLKWSHDEMAQLFYADSLRLDATTGVLHGAQYILARQIIREHDAHCGTRGCRIIPRNGNTLDFYIPMAV